MISGEDIGNYIQNPLAVKSAELDDFSVLIKKYPYCSSLQILYLKGLALHNHLDFEKQLKSTAIHSPDRAHLYTLIHSGEPEIEQLESESETIIEKEIIEVVVPADLPLEQEPIRLEKTTRVEELDPLDISILTTAFDASFLETTISENNYNTAEETKALIDKEVHQDKTETEIEPEDDTLHTTESNEPLSFSAWLKLKQSSIDIQPEVGEIKEQATPRPKKKSKSEIDALLNKFMTEEPRISKPIREFYNPVENARKSVQETDTIVSETLAKIHVKQKNYSKAISAYEKLILLYPEKKTFFASQIEKIREEIKNK